MNINRSGCKDVTLRIPYDDFTTKLLYKGLVAITEVCPELIYGEPFREGNYMILRTSVKAFNVWKRLKILWRTSIWLKKKK